MRKSLALIIVFISSFVLTHSLNENVPFQMHQEKIQSNGTSHKVPKKSRITEKQKFQVYDFLESIKDAFTLISEVTTDFFNAFVLRKTKPAEKQSIIYRQNFASENGGAQILMVSSSKIKSPKAILRTDPDAYLFTADVLPITIVIALKQEILIDSFAIQSGEAYSCITNDFMLEGAFSLDNEEWMHMGNFTAENSFQTQEFAVQQKIIRYIRFTILSSYGKWKYFTLSQVKVYGEGLFSHAMESLLQTEYNIQGSLKTNSSQNISNFEKGTKTVNSKKGGQKMQTKEILVQALEGLVSQEQKSMNRNQALGLQDLYVNESSYEAENFGQKDFSKDKKSISILKKKVSYLERRNFQLNQELKSMRNVLEKRLVEIQAKQQNQSTGKQVQNSQWYNYLMSTESMVIFSMLINISCLILVALVFKRKILSSRMSQSTRLSQSFHEESSPKQNLSQSQSKKLQNLEQTKESKSSTKNTHSKQKFQ